MNSLAFQFDDSPDSNDHEVRPLVDGVDILKLNEADSLGIDPPEFFRQSALLQGGRLLIGRCSCGVVGCDDVYASVVKADGSVTWELSGNLKYKFDPSNYSATIGAAATSTDWESIERTAERIVSQLNFRPIEEHGYHFEWASARIARGRIALSFSKSDTQRLFEVGWDGQDPEDAARQVRRWVREYA